MRRAVQQWNRQAWDVVRSRLLEVFKQKLNGHLSGLQEELVATLDDPQRLFQH